MVMARRQRERKPTLLLPKRNNPQIHHPFAVHCPLSSPIPSTNPANRSASGNEFHRCFDGKGDGGMWMSRCGASNQGARQEIDPA